MPAVMFSCRLIGGNALPSPNRLKVEWDTQLLENLFVFSEIFISKIIESAALFELFEEGVYLSAQLVITLAYSHRPFFGLKRLQDRAGRVLIFSPVLKD